MCIGNGCKLHIGFSFFLSEILRNKDYNLEHMLLILGTTFFFSLTGKETSLHSAEKGNSIRSITHQKTQWVWDADDYCSANRLWWESLRRGITVITLAISDQWAGPVNRPSLIGSISLSLDHKNTSFNPSPQCFSGFHSPLLQVGLAHVIFLQLWMYGLFTACWSQFCK